MFCRLRKISCRALKFVAGRQGFFLSLSLSPFLSLHECVFSPSRHETQTHIKIRWRRKTLPAAAAARCCSSQWRWQRRRNNISILLFQSSQSLSTGGVCLQISRSLLVGERFCFNQMRNDRIEKGCMLAGNELVMGKR